MSIELLKPFKEAKQVYDPRKKARRLLTAAMEYIRNAPYKVSVRWVSYRLLQDGHLKNKESFGQIENYMREARRCSYEDWTPFTFADSVRETINAPDLDDGPDSYDPEYMAQRNIDTIDSFYVDIPRWYYEDCYLEVWFEARAMTGQFEKYVPSGIALQPCGGDLSIPLKAEGARRLRDCADKIGKEPVILYFGDLDKKGEQIPKSIGTEVYAWCPGVKIYRCGLDVAQQKKYGLPENPESPGKYQWEALDDEAAKEIISEGLEAFLNDGACDKAKEREQEIAQEAQEILKEKLSEYLEEME